MNYSLCARLRFMNFTQMEWTVELLTFFAHKLSLHDQLSYLKNCLPTLFIKLYVQQVLTAQKLQKLNGKFQSF